MLQNLPTGLPGSIKTGTFFIIPKDKGLPGLIATFEKIILPTSLSILIKKSL